MSLAEFIHDHEQVNELNAIAAPKLPKDHLSASSLSMYSRCPEQWRKVYVLGERQRPGAALVWGGADHYAHEQNFRQKIDSHEDIPVAEVEIAFAEGFDRKVEQEGGETEIEWGGDKPGDVKDKGVALVAAYHKFASPGIQPVHVERPISLDLPGVPVPIIGRPDVETADSVVERKTSAARKRSPEPQWRLQGAVYGIATGMPVDWHVCTKTKVPGVYTPSDDAGLRLTVSPLLAEATIRRVRLTVASIVTNLATLGPDTPWGSGAPDYGWACDYCGFRPSCAHWGAPA